MPKCLLCQHERTLLRSHIIPKFVGKWLTTSGSAATGAPARLLNSKMQVKQDLPTQNWFCKDCEATFSLTEKAFATHVFYPFLRQHQTSFQYEGWLKHFAVGIAFRTALWDIIKGAGQSNAVVQYLQNQTFPVWREYLLGRRSDPGTVSINIAFLGAASAEQEREFAPNFNRFLHRGVNAHVVKTSSALAVMIKLPSVLFWVDIIPSYTPGWKGTLVSDRGVYNAQDTEIPGVVVDLLVDLAGGTNSPPSPIMSSPYPGLVWVPVRQPMRFNALQKMTFWVEPHKRS